jgi:hypothetical protein
MKNSTSNLRTPPFIFSTILLCMLCLNSCTKDVATTATAYLSMVNTSPTLGTYHFYFDGTKLNTAAMPFGGTIAYANYTAGDHTAKFTTESASESLLTKTISLDGDGVYSLYLIERPEKLDALLVRDVMTVASTTQAFIRFINLSPDAPALDLTVSGGTDKIVSGKSYKAASDFQAINPNTYSFDIKDSNMGAIKTTLSEVTITAGKYYTIISRGVLNVGETDQPFSAQLITNL